MKLLKWFQIVLKFKQWLLPGLIGIVFIAGALLLLLKDVAVGPVQMVGSIVLVLVGLYSLLICFNKIFLKFVSVYSNGILKKPSNVKEIGDVLLKRKLLSKGPKVVVIGGGTGISTMLRGLKQYTSNITAVITVADDGGGSGMLRDDLGMLPPGDIRNCMVALAETEPVLEKLLNYRFPEGRLKGQNFGNLFLAAMNGISSSFEEAVTHMGEVLAVTGRILPVTEEDVHLVAELEDGTVIRGESRIGKHHLSYPGRIKRIQFDKSDVKPLPDVLAAIEEAEIIILGPGSLYTSIIPNLLVDGVAKAIEASKAMKFYICNIMTQPGETEHYTVGHHIQAMKEHSGCCIIDFCLTNKGDIRADILKKYEEDGANQVMIDLSTIKKMGIQLIERDLVMIRGDYVRHDPDKLARAILDIYKMIPLKQVSW